MAISAGDEECGLLAAAEAARAMSRSHCLSISSSVRCWDGPSRAMERQ